MPEPIASDRRRRAYSIPRFSLPTGVARERHFASRSRTRRTARRQAGLQKRAGARDVATGAL